MLIFKSAYDAGALSEMPRHKYRGLSSAAPSENDRINDLLQIESYCEKIFELDQSLDITTLKCTGQQIKHKYQQISGHHISAPNVCSKIAIQISGTLPAKIKF